MGSLHAVLIGVDEYGSAAPQLFGARNDIAA